MSTQRELDGKVCAITGAGRGIGAATAAVLAREGGRIAILERDANLGESAKLTYGAAGPTYGYTCWM
jgi:NAD(P)-dependent dehydrogenase (short-subunit alcohol dehydrogenase family)